MIAVCPACKSEYPLNPAKLPAAGGFFTCRTCGERVGIPPRANATAAPPDELSIRTSTPAAADAMGSVPIPPLPALEEPAVPAPPVLDLASEADTSAGDESSAPRTLPPFSAVREAAAPPAADPEPDDLPALERRAADADDLPAPVAERRPVAETSPLSESTREFDDLPAPTNASEAVADADADVLDDLPALVNVPDSTVGTEQLDDLPAPASISTAAGDVPDDRPALVHASTPAADRHVGAGRGTHALQEEDLPTPVDADLASFDLPAPLASDEPPPLPPSGPAAANRASEATTIALEAPPALVPSARPVVSAPPPGPSAPAATAPNVAASSAPAAPPVPAVAASKAEPADISLEESTLAADALAAEALEPSREALATAPSAPALMDELLTARPPQAEPPPPAPTATVTLPLDGTILETSGSSKRRRRPALLVGAAAAAIVIVAGGLVAWRLGFLGRDRAASVERGREAGRQAAAVDRDSGAGTAAPAERRPDSPRTAGDASGSTSPPPPRENPPSNGTPPRLDAAGALTLDLAELRPAADALATELAGAPDPARAGILLWSYYRLAAQGDVGARARLVREAPPTAEAAKLGPFAIAATAGAMLLDGKINAARALAERALRTRFRDAPALALVAARTYGRPVEAAKALRYYDLALAGEPEFVDAQLGRAQILLGKPATAAEGTTALARLGAKLDDPWHAIAAVDALLAAGRFEAADTATAAWAAGAFDVLAPLQRSRALRLLVRRRLREGDIGGALAAAQARVAAAPGAEAWLELARLEGLQHPKEAADRLAKAAASLTDPEIAGRLFAERVRLLLAAGDVDGAGALVAAPPAGTSYGWLKHAEALVAGRRGDVSRAAAAHAVAAQVKPPIVASQVALALAAPKPAVRLQRLTQLAKKVGSPPAEYALARHLIELGNHVGAVPLLERVLWSDPTIAPPFELMRAWVRALAGAGAGARAEKLARAMRQAHPDDPLPLRLVIELAEETGKPDAVVEAYRALVALLPDSTDDRLALAAALTNAGKTREAEGVIIELQRSKPDLKSPELLLQLGRALVERDPVKARGLMRDSIQLEPRGRTYAALGDLEATLGRSDEAMAAYRSALELDSALSSVRYALVRLMLQKGAAGDAVKELKRLVAADPRDARARELLGDALLELDDVKAAAAAYQVAAEAGNSVPVLMKLARVQLQQLGLVAPAVKTLRRVVKVDGKHAEAHYYLGLALKDLGKLGEARSELKAYLALAPQGEFAADAQRFVDDLERM